MVTITIIRPDPARPRGRQRPKGNGYVPPLPRFYSGLDLGQAHDSTALAIAERVLIPQMSTDAAMATLPEYHICALDRAPLGTPYPRIAKSMATLFRRPPLASAGVLIVDATGVGRPVVDNLRQEGLSPIAVTITGGSNVTGGGKIYRVPKNDLISGLIVLFQTKRIKIAAALPHAETPMRELEAMRMRITASGNDQYGAHGEGEHDDLVLALALAVWYAERRDRRHRARHDRLMQATDLAVDGALASSI